MGQAKAEVRSNFRQKQRIRKLVGGILILYIFVFMALWFVYLYLIAEHLSTLPKLLMVSSVPILAILLFLSRKAKQSLLAP